MSQNSEEYYRTRATELEMENARLRETLQMVTAERKELRDIVCGPVREQDRPSEEDYLEMMRNHIPGSGMKFLAELGIFPEKTS